LIWRQHFLSQPNDAEGWVDSGGLEEIGS